MIKQLYAKTFYFFATLFQKRTAASPKGDTAVLLFTAYTAVYAAAYLFQLTSYSSLHLASAYILLQLTAFCLRATMLSSYTMVLAGWKPLKLVAAEAQ